MLARIRCIRRASRGRLLAPLSCNDVAGKDALMLAVAELPLSSCDCVFGCVEDCVGGLGFGGFAVAGGVEMPFGICSAAGEAMMGGCGRVGCW